MMINIINFKIESLGEISDEFLKRQMITFSDAIQFVRNLHYARNSDKENLKNVFIDNCGTCSTKHALLKSLADENGRCDIKLYMGIFKMNTQNTEQISKTFRKNNLTYIPEAHNYLKYQNNIFDFTKRDSKPSDFANHFISEIEISPSQITDYKIEYHKKFLKNWLEQNPQIKFSLNEIWEIREQCILDLSKPDSTVF